VEVANVVRLDDQVRRVLREGEPVAEDPDVLVPLVEQ
jgi:hypothetical protein